MAVELEGLEFEIRGESESAAKGLDALTTSLSKLKNIAGNITGLQTVSRHLQKIGDSLKDVDAAKGEALARVFEAIERISGKKISSTISAQISAIGNAAKELKDEDVGRLERYAQAIEKIAAAGRVNASRINTMPNTRNMPSQEGGQLVPVNSPVQDVSSRIQTGSEVNAVNSQLSQIDIGSRRLASFLPTLKKIGSYASSAGTKVAGLVKQTALLPVTLGSKLASKVKQSTSTLGSFFSSIKRIAMYRAIRAAISAITKGLGEGIKNLYQYSNMMGGTFARSMDSLATNAQYLKNSLGAMAAPIINALAPAIDYITDKIVDLFNMINQLIARLTGKSTYTAAKKSFTSYADSVKNSAGGAAKALKSFTTGIDELNIIEDSAGSGGSGGGSGGGGNVGSMFEELGIDSGISDFADRLKEAFNNSDWEGLGKLLGGKVNELVDSVNWSGIGTKIGAALNAGVQTAYYTLDTIDFIKIGDHLAELLNNALETTDFSFIGRLTIKPFTSLADMIIGFLGTLKWGTVASSISDYIKGLFNEASDWLDSLDWNQLGSDLWQDIKDFLEHFDFAGVASNFFTFLGTAIQKAAQFLSGFFGSIVADIKKWWNDDIAGDTWEDTAENLFEAIKTGFGNYYDWVTENISTPFVKALIGDKEWEKLGPGGQEVVQKFLRGIISPMSAISTFSQWIKEHIVDPFVTWLRKKFEIDSNDSDIVKIGKSVGSGILNGVLHPFKTISDWITKNIVTPITTWLKKKFGIDSDDSKSSVFEIGVKVAKSILNGILHPFQTISNWVSSNIIAPLKKAFGTNPIAEFTVGVKKTLNQWWDNIVAWWKEKFGASPDDKHTVGSFSVNPFNRISEWWTKIKNWWKEKFGAAANDKNAIGNFTVSPFKRSGDWWTSIKKWWKEQFGDNGQNAAGFFTVNPFNRASAWWQKIVQWWREKFGYASNTDRDVGSFNVDPVNRSDYWWYYVFYWWRDKVGTVDSFKTDPANNSNTWWENVKSWWKHWTDAGKVSSFKTQPNDDSSFWWTSVKNWWNGASKDGLSTKAKITSFLDSLNSDSKVLSFAAKLVSRTLGSNFSTVIDVTAKLIDRIFGPNFSSVIDLTGRITSISTPGGGHTSGGFASGGFISNGKIVHWGAIPAYAGGTLNAHGTMFLAGEAGPEIVGHIGGKTEVLNRSQLAFTMYRSVSDAFRLVVPYLKVIGTQQIRCANAQIAATLQAVSARLEDVESPSYYYPGTQMRSMDAAREEAVENDAIGYTVLRQALDDFFRERLEQTISGMADDMRRQADKEERTTLKIGNKTIADAVTAQQRADGYKFNK